MEPALFRVALARRLRLRVIGGEARCPACGEIMDEFGDHALVCCCRGDRTVRHNRLINLLASEAKMAGLGVCMEKQGLLPPRLAEDGIGEDFTRRPADIWWADGAGGRDVAWDLAATSGMQTKWISKGPEHVEQVLAEYDQRKRDHLDTDRQCAEQGFKFQLLLFEAPCCQLV